MRRVLWGALVAAAVAAIACGGSPTSATKTGTFAMAMTDGPFSTAQALLITFSDVSVHNDTTGWTKLPFSDGGTTRTCDLKRLTNGATDILGVGQLPVGQYQQARLTITSAGIYFDAPTTGPVCAPSITPPSGANVTVTIPNGQVFLNRGFTITADTRTTMTVDFNGDQSVIMTGNGTYMMSPVINVVSVQ